MNNKSETILSTFEENVLNWSNERDLFPNTNEEKQFIKMIEEIGELARAILHQNKTKAKDAIGDIYVILVQMCCKLGFTVKEAEDFAWNEIKNRKGKMFNGTFIKESDLK